MNIIPAKTPRLLKGLYPNYIWDKPNGQSTIYLTFDDGPTPEITNWTLDLLEAYRAKATFFCIGNNIEKHPELFRDILKRGHGVGNHTYDHPEGWQTNTDAYIESVLKTQKLMHQHQSNFKPQSSGSALTIPSGQPLLFRPPYGKIKRRQGRRLLGLGYDIIMWDVLAFDWKDSISKEQAAKNVTSNAKPGSIVVFHDSVKASKRMQYALPITLDHFSNKGYQFKSLVEF